MKKIFFIFVFITSIALESTGQEKLKTKNGLQYTLLSSNANFFVRKKLNNSDEILNNLGFANNQLFLNMVNKLKPKTGKVGDIAKINVVLKNYKDSIIFERLVEKEPVKNAQKGDITEIMQYMAEGDSVLCVISVDSLFVGEMAAQRPAFFPLGTDMKYYLKMYSLKNAELLRLAEEAKMAALKAKQAKEIQEYAIQNKLDLMTTPSGLYYVITKKNPTGAPAKNGVNVGVNYVGQLLNGKVFDTSIKEVAQKAGKFVEGTPYEPLRFMLGQQGIIRGWNDGIILMRTGEKATLLVPSYLAYGERSPTPDIPANSILRFDVELTQVELTKTDAERKSDEMKEIQNYAIKSKLKLSKTASGLHYVITKKNPTGKQATNGSNVSVSYVGQLLNGKIFDTSIKEIAEKAGKYMAGRPYEPYKFPLGQSRVIKGWDEGIALMKTGEQAILLVPSSLAYGDRPPTPDIPVNGILRFDVELTQVD
ncbi:MAG: hypothetical protein EAZ85_11680 [Bacteroidetes bacterium]|nr:MAG: hypothetical protein EAZ85_11680 [Bacteroidota bacterium]TAG87443.1 MAG: hypothetical protein EAZ20_10645 [Bacteroidota bacterium]